MPAVAVHQVVGRAFAKVTLVVAEASTNAERKRRANNVRQLFARLIRHAGRYGDDDVLVVMQKAVEQEIRANLTVPAWMYLAHHGVLAGLDVFKGVRALYVVGRRQAPSATVARTAGALSGEAVDPAIDYALTPVLIPTVSGGGVEVETIRHPDPLAEAVRWQITEADLLQAIGAGGV